MSESKVLIQKPADVSIKTWEKFKEYHRNNPKIWELFQKYSHEILKAGIKRSSGVTILGRIRYECLFEYKGEFKVNHNFAPVYCRIFIQKFPEHEGFFVFHKLEDKDVFGE